MNLDFTGLSQPASATPVHEPWGQAGTAGTPASVGDPASPGDGDTPGTGGDGTATTPRNADMAEGASGLAPMRSPQSSPQCPPPQTARRVSAHAVSPLSPLVPSIATADTDGDDVNREAFEERAAILEFDGGMTRANAETAARAHLGTVT